MQINEEFISQLTDFQLIGLECEQKRYHGYFDNSITKEIERRQIYPEEIKRISKKYLENDNFSYLNFNLRKRKIDILMYFIILCLAIAMTFKYSSHFMAIMIALVSIISNNHRVIYGKRGFDRIWNLALNFFSFLILATLLAAMVLHYIHV